MFTLSALKNEQYVFFKSYTLRQKQTTPTVNSVSGMSSSLNYLVLAESHPSTWCQHRFCLKAKQINHKEIQGLLQEIPSCPLDDWVMKLIIRISWENFAKIYICRSCLDFLRDEALESVFCKKSLQEIVIIRQWWDHCQGWYSLFLIKMALTSPSPNTVAMGNSLTQTNMGIFCNNVWYPVLLTYQVPTYKHSMRARFYKSMSKQFKLANNSP